MSLPATQAASNPLPLLGGRGFALPAHERLLFGVTA